MWQKCPTQVEEKRSEMFLDCHFTVSLWVSHISHIYVVRDALSLRKQEIQNFSLCCSALLLYDERP